MANDSKANANKRGRKNRYETHVKPNFPLIAEWCKTLTERQISERLGIAYSTFNWYKATEPELAEILKKGRQDLVADLRSTLIQKAKGYEYTERKEVTERIKLPEFLHAYLLDSGFTPEELDKCELVRTEVSHKHMAPDVAAINLALKNYDKDNWANDPQALELKKKELALKEKQIEQNDW